MAEVYVSCTEIILNSFYYADIKMKMRKFDPNF